MTFWELGRKWEKNNNMAWLRYFVAWSTEHKRRLEIGEIGQKSHTNGH